ncbi:MAG: ABC transporter substrate-binding protein [Stenotrophomonas sp.]
MKSLRFASAPWLLCLWLFLLLPAQAAARVVHDMSGAPVEVPARIERVVTLGATPVLNSLVFAVGGGRHIVNGLPEFARQPRWNYQYLFAPQLAGRPSLANVDRTPNLEALLAAAPDLILTMDRSSAQTLRRVGLPAFQLSWAEPDEVKTAITLLGELFGNPAAARRYGTRFDGTVGEVERLLRQAQPARPRVLYFNPRTLSRPHPIADWWIEAAGGTSISAGLPGNGAFNLETLLAWDPDILIVSSPAEAASVLADPRFARLKAVRARRVLATPCGAHIWGNRSAEQPLAVLWAAKQFHPQVFAGIDLVERTQSFYRDLFGVPLSRAQVAEILAGGPSGRDSGIRFPPLQGHSP